MTQTACICCRQKHVTRKTKKNEPHFIREASGPAHKRHNRAYSFPDSARNKWPPAAKPTSRKWHPNLPKQQKKGWLILVAAAPTSTCWRALHPNLLVPIPPSGHHAAASDWCRDLILVRSTHGHRWPNPNLTGVITTRSAPKKLRIASEMDL